MFTRQTIGAWKEISNNKVPTTPKKTLEAGGEKVYQKLNQIQNHHSEMKMKSKKIDTLEKKEEMKEKDQPPNTDLTQPNDI